MALSKTDINFKTTEFPPNLPAGANVVAVIGTASTGTDNVMKTFTRNNSKAVETEYTEGPLVTLTNQLIKSGAGTIRCVKATKSTAGVIQSVRRKVDATTTDVVAGTPNVSITGEPVNSYDLVVQITDSGARGTANFRYSLDAGSNWSAKIATQATYAIPATGVTLNFADTPAATDYVKNDEYHVHLVAPRAESTNIQTAMDVLKNEYKSNQNRWNALLIGEPLDNTEVTALSAKLDTFETTDKVFGFIIASSLEPEQALQVDGVNDVFTIHAPGTGDNVIDPAADITLTANVNGTMATMATDMATQLKAASAVPGTASWAVTVVQDSDGNDVFKLDASGTAGVTSITVSKTTTTGKIDVTNQLFGGVVDKDTVADTWTGNVPKQENETTWTDRIIADRNSFSGGNRIGWMAGGYRTIEFGTGGRTQNRSGVAHYIGRAMELQISQSPALRSQSYAGVQALWPADISVDSQNKLSDAGFIVPIRAPFNVFTVDEDLMMPPVNTNWTHMRFRRIGDSLSLDMIDVADSFTAHRTDPNSISVFTDELNVPFDKMKDNLDILVGAATLPPQDFQTASTITIDASFTPINVAKNFVINIGFTAKNPLAT